MTRITVSQPPLRLMIAALFCVLLVGSFLIVGATIAHATPLRAADTAHISTGQLSWGFKESFRRYIGGVSAMTASDGAVLDSAGVATYPLNDGSFDKQTGTTDLRFSGSIRYRAHCESGLGLPAGECALDSTYSNLHLLISQAEQALYADVVARQVTDGYPMNDFGTLRIATLTPSRDNYSATDTNTVWTGIPSAAAKEGSPATAYGAGTPLDPVSATYVGPGGLPETGEHWTEPGTVQLGTTAEWTADVPQNQPTSVFSDPHTGIVHVVNQRTSHDLNAPAITAFNQDNLAVLGESADLPATDWDDTGAFDPTTGTVFLYQANPDGTQTILAATWEAATATYRHLIVDAHALTLGSFTYDSANSRLVAITESEDYTAPFLTSWTRTAEGWQRADLPLPVIETRAEQVSYYTPAGGTAALTAQTNGTLVLTRGLVTDANSNILDANPEPLTLRTDNASVSVATVAGSVTVSGPDAQPGEAGNVYAGPNDTFALAPNGASWGSAFVRLGHIDGDASVLDSGRILLPTTTGEPVVASFSSDGQTVWAKAVTSGTIAAIRNAKIISSYVNQDAARSYTFAALSNDAAVTGGRNAGQQSTVTRVGTVGISPTITLEPRTAIVNNGDNATFTATATGTPLPSVRWQQSSDGLSYTDVPGATSTEFTIQANPATADFDYRAIFANTAGALASPAATITLATPPQILVHPQDATVTEGDDVSFEVMSIGNPEPTIIWEQQKGNSWTRVGASNATTGDGSITFKHTTGSQNGLTIRATASNIAGTVTTDAVTLTITQKSTTSPPAPTGDDKISNIQGPDRTHRAQNLATTGMTATNMTITAIAILLTVGGGAILVWRHHAHRRSE